MMSSVHTADMNSPETPGDEQEPQNFNAFHQPHRLWNRPCPLCGHEALAHRRRTVHPTTNRWRQAPCPRCSQMDSCQVSSRDSRKRHAAETPKPQVPAKRTQEKSGRHREARQLPACRPLTSGRKPVDRETGPGGSSRPTQPASGAAQTQDDEAGRQQDRGHGQHTDRHTRHRQPPLPNTLGRRPLSGARAPLRVLAATSTHHDLVVVAAPSPARGLRAGARAVRH